MKLDRAALVGILTDMAQDDLPNIGAYADRIIAIVIPPGRCGTPAPTQMRRYTCELLAGHTGMHQANDWTTIATDRLGSPSIVAWTDPADFR